MWRWTIACLTGFLRCGGPVWLMGFDSGGRWLGFWVGVCQVVVSDGFLDSPCGGGTDALVDRECLLQVRGALAGVAVLEVGPAESFQGACLLQGCAKVAGDG